MGDGVIMFTVTEDTGYQETRKKVVERGDDWIGVDLGRPDFVALPRDLGCLGVFDPIVAEMTGEVAKAFDTAWPALIHVHEVRCGLARQQHPSDAP